MKLSRSTTLAGAAALGRRQLVALSSVLGFVAGLVDTATFFEMPGLFVAHVTGDFVRLGATLAGSPIERRARGIGAAAARLSTHRMDGRLGSPVTVRRGT